LETDVPVHESQSLYPIFIQETTSQAMRESAVIGTEHREGDGIDANVVGGLEEGQSTVQSADESSSKESFETYFLSNMSARTI